MYKMVREPVSSRSDYRILMGRAALKYGSDGCGNVTTVEQCQRKEQRGLSDGISLLVGRRHLRARRRDRALRSPTSTARTNHRFWMATAILTVNIPGIPNEAAR
jgi:hypothetical protein